MEIKQLKLLTDRPQKIDELSKNGVVTTAQVLPNGHIRFTSVKQPLKKK